MALQAVDKLKKILERFSKVRVLVLGDIMLDQYWWGNVNRISPEAPVPVVRLTKTSMIAGGAANVAANVAGLGAEPFLVGVVGTDKEARLLPELLAESRISSGHLVELPDRPTTVKTRVVAHSQQIVRIDQETNRHIDRAEEDLVWREIEKCLDLINIVIVSDYAKGVITDTLLARLITAVEGSGIKVLVDPKGKNYSKYRGATLLTPNKREAAEACGFDDDGSDVVDEAGKHLISELDLAALLITQGEEGMTLFQKDLEPVHQTASARAVYDVTGAGDTVIATLAVGIGAGADLVEASKLANIAAGIVVEQVGTTTIDLNELRRLLGESNEKAVNLN